MQSAYRTGATSRQGRGNAIIAASLSGGYFFWRKMGKYPEVVTADDLEKLSHIDNAEIQRDMDETVSEIKALEKEVEGLRLIAEAKAGTPAGKMATFKLGGAEQGIKERQEFVTFLEQVLAERRKE